MAANTLLRLIFSPVKSQKVLESDEFILAFTFIHVAAEKFQQVPAHYTADESIGSSNIVSSHQLNTQYSPISMEYIGSAISLSKYPAELGLANLEES